MKLSLHAVIAIALLSTALAVAEDVHHEPPVELPPLVIEAHSGGPRWRYLETPEYEILSQCDDDTTRDIAEAQHRMHQLLAYILPGAAQPRGVLPRIMIVYDEAILPSSTQAALSLLGRDNADAPIPSAANLSRDRPIKYLANPSLHDAERVAVFVRVPRSGRDPDLPAPDFGFGDVGPSRLKAAPVQLGWTTLTSGYVGYLLRARMPALPEWFRSGFLRLYDHATFQSDTVMLDPFNWSSGGQTLALRNGQAAALPLRPLSELFAGRYSEDQLGAWLSEAELFIRWGLQPDRQTAFWNFLQRSASEPPTETLFASCFHLSFAAAEQELRTTAPLFARESTLIRGPKLGSLDNLRPRNATRLEIARVKGEAERLETSYVRGRQPDYVAPFLEQTRRTLRAAYEKGSRDPELLAVMGLCELEADEPDAAKPWLAAAAAGQCDHARVYYELARMTYDDAVGQTVPPIPLSDADREKILGWLRQAVVKRPTIRECYMLFAQLESTRALALGNDAGLLQLAASLYPQDAELACACALALSRHGEVAAAHEVTQRALRFDPPSAFRDRLRELVR